MSAISAKLALAAFLAVMVCELIAPPRQAAVAAAPAAQTEILR